MDPRDPAANFSINNFNKPDLSDVYKWGIVVDLLTESRRASPTGTIKPFSVNLVDYELNRYKAESLDWTINFRRRFYGGEPYSTTISPITVNVNIIAGTGSSSVETNFDGEKLREPLFSSTQLLNSIPMHGAAYHVCTERMTLILNGLTKSAVTPRQGEYDRLYCWISRGVPHEHYVVKMTTDDPASALKNPITIPDGAVEFTAFGYQYNGPNSRINTTFRIADYVSGVPIIPPASALSMLQTVPQTENFNKFTIPPWAEAIYPSNVGGPGSINTVFNFKCIL